MTGGQFHLYDIDDKRWSAAFVGYGKHELSVVELEQDIMQSQLQHNLIFHMMRKWHIG